MHVEEIIHFENQEYTSILILDLISGIFCKRKKCVIQQDSPTRFPNKHIKL